MTQPPYPPPVKQPKKRHRGLKIGAGIVGVLVLMGIIGAVTGSGDTKKADPHPAGTITVSAAAKSSQSARTTSKAPATKAAATKAPTKAATPSTTVGKGFGSQDASGDVKLGKPTSNGYWVTIPVTVTNHSSKRSDYFIDVSLESADGKTQFDTGSAIAQRVEPGQSAVAEVMLTKVKEAPVGAKPSLKSVQRSPSI